MRNNETTGTPQDHRLRIFLCYCSTDGTAAQDLYRRLKLDGFAPWLDKEELLPGQDWHTEIPKIVRASHATIVCLSKDFNQAGYRQKEVRLALEVAEQQPHGTISIIPVRLDDVEIPMQLSQWHWANLFEENGYQRLITALTVRANELGLTAGTSMPDVSKIAKMANPAAIKTGSAEIREGEPRNVVASIFKQQAQLLVWLYVAALATILILIGVLYFKPNTRQSENVRQKEPPPQVKVEQPTTTGDGSPIFSHSPINAPTTINIDASDGKAGSDDKPAGGTTPARKAKVKK
jgi:hypothetical protein